MNIWNLVSLLLEIGVVVLGLGLAVIRKKAYGWLIALTFLIYVFYDLARFLRLDLDQRVLDSLFVVASGAIFLALWRLFSDGK
jgi:hypothetical protein